MKSSLVNKSKKLQLGRPKCYIMTTGTLRQFLALKSRCFFKNIRRVSTEACNALECIPDDKPFHTPVMVTEVIDYLSLKEGDFFLDMTFGAGGHSSALLERIPQLKVLALDRDPVAQEFAMKLEKKYPNQILHLHGKFSDLPLLLKNMKVEKQNFDGILFDLGCSSMQFDYPERGFSVIKDGPLDMRMDGNSLPKQLTAADVVAYASEDDLYKILKIYGEEPKSRKIARAIVEARCKFKPLKTTKHLSELVETVCGMKGKTDKLNRKAHVATKVFQALRIFVNNEINEINSGIMLAHKYLKPGGRVVVISFHSLEDQIIKRHFNNSMEDYSRTSLELFNSAKFFGTKDMKAINKKLWEPLHKKVIVPSNEEVNANPRSRSAKLRAALKCADM